MTYDPIENERLARMAAEGLMRGRSREAPRALPVQRHTFAPASVPITADLRPCDTQIGPAILRITERSERVEKAVVAERKRMDEARAQPKVKTRGVAVENPYGHEYTDEQGIRHNRPDHVERVVDTIDLMLRARQIDRGQEAASRKVRDAWEQAPGSLRCALAPGIGGGVPSSGSITESQRWAGEVLNDVRAALGELDAPIVIRIAGIGHSVEETARVVFGGRDAGSKVSEREIHHVGMRFRMGLAHLARRWRIEGKGGAKVAGLRGAVAGHDNPQNFGAMSEAERERHMPLRSAAEQRDQRLAKKLKRKRAKKAAEQNSP